MHSSRNWILGALASLSLTSGAWAGVDSSGGTFILTTMEEGIQTHIAVPGEKIIESCQSEYLLPTTGKPASGFVRVIEKNGKLLGIYQPWGADYTKKTESVTVQTMSKDQALEREREFTLEVLESLNIDLNEMSHLKLIEIEKQSIGPFATILVIYNSRNEVLGKRGSFGFMRMGAPCLK